MVDLCYHGELRGQTFFVGPGGYASYFLQFVERGFSIAPNYFHWWCVAGPEEPIIVEE